MSVEIDGVNNIIKTNTISEVTSANGVAIDGATLKDGTVKASINTSTQTTAAITLDNTVSGGFGASLAWDVHRSDSGNQATAARIYPSRADVWNSDAASDSDLNFQVSQNGTVATRMTVSGTGDVSIADGNVLFQGAGHGVYLGVTSATAANLLDDYEEGTFAYTIVGSTSGNLVLRSGYARGSYVKIGNLVHVDIRFETSSDNSISGNLRWSLPFTMATPNGSDADSAAAPGYIRDNSLGTNARTGVYLVAEAQAYAQLLFSREGAANSTVELANDGNTDGVMEGVISITYRTT